MNRARFERPVRIRFAHCDPAGIVYFPQYLVMTNGLVEDWFNESLCIDYSAMIRERRIGLPIVRLDCAFAKPSRMGETITLSLELLRIGRSSITVDIAGHADGETRFTTQQVLVANSLDTGAALGIPADIRRAYERFASFNEETQS
jgi:4-hydroxybenzoyl-CoA thioesterase